MVLKSLVGDDRLGGIDNNSGRLKQCEANMMNLSFSTWVERFSHW